MSTEKSQSKIIKKHKIIKAIRKKNFEKLKIEKVHRKAKNFQLNKKALKIIDSAFFT